MNIGIIGAGQIGGTLGRLWAQTGHVVRFAARTPASAERAAAAAGHGAQAAGLDETARFGEVTLIAVPFGAWPTLAVQLTEALTGRIVVDTTNPYPARDGAIVAEVAALGRGSGAFVQALLPGAHLVKAFNTLGATWLKSEAGQNPPLAVPLASDDAEAVRLVAGLIEDAGFAPVPVAGIDAAARFDAGTPVYGKQLTAAALAATLDDGDER